MSEGKCYTYQFGAKILWENITPKYVEGENKWGKHCKVVKKGQSTTVFLPLFPSSHTLVSFFLPNFGARLVKITFSLRPEEALLALTSQKLVWI